MVSLEKNIQFLYRKGTDYHERFMFFTLLQVVLVLQYAYFECTIRTHSLLRLSLVKETNEIFLISWRIYPKNMQELIDSAFESHKIILFSFRPSDWVDVVP
jgi:hypothetical protein